MFHVSLPYKSYLQEFISKSISNFDQKSYRISSQKYQLHPRRGRINNRLDRKSKYFLTRQVIMPNPEYSQSEPSHHLEDYV